MDWDEILKGFSTEIAEMLAQEALECAWVGVPIPIERWSSLIQRGFQEMLKDYGYSGYNEILSPPHSWSGSCHSTNARGRVWCCFLVWARVRWQLYVQRPALQSQQVYSSQPHVAVGYHRKGNECTERTRGNRSHNRPGSWGFKSRH